MIASNSSKPPLDTDELPLDSNFIEQAEYIPENAFLQLNAAHPNEESIVRRLSAGGAKLLVGPRGCGKTTLMLKAFYGLLRDPQSTTFPIYVNFKLSLKIEPLYHNTPNATFWFRLWLILKVYEGLYYALSLSKHHEYSSGLPSRDDISSMLSTVESGRIDTAKHAELYTTVGLADHVSALLSTNGLTRCVLLLDDAAHAFSPRQQEDFFEFFRDIKSREISPKAAIYPGITTHSPTFHVGHDAEQIDAWIRPDNAEYLTFMRSLAEKRFGGELPRTLRATPNAVEFLSYSAFGIPRSFLNMLRAVYHEESGSSSKSTVDRRKLLSVSKLGRESAHNVYESLQYKIPAYKEFVSAGRDIYQKIISILKTYNRTRDDSNQAFEIGIRRPVPSDIEKVLSFFQYAGLLMPNGFNSRGEKGIFDLYLVHFGDLITDNAIIVKRTKSISDFVTAFSAQTHQAWPRVNSTSLVSEDRRSSVFKLRLPHCQNCGAERASDEARFCHNCGAQLKTASLYVELTQQDISVLPLSKKMIARIKDNSSIRTIKDILIDDEKIKLRGIPFIGPVRAGRIASYAEEYVA